MISPAGRHKRAALASAITVIGILLLQSPVSTFAATKPQKPAQISCSYKGATTAKQFSVNGATPNDQKDDGPAIQKALDSAKQAGGGVVKLPAGTFITNTHLVVGSNTTFTGIGPSTVIKAGPDFLAREAPSYGYPVITTNGAMNVTITNLTADQSSDTLNAANLGGRLVGYLVEGRSSHNVVIRDVTTRNPFTYSIAMVQSSGFCVTNNVTRVTSNGKYDQLDGIHILDSNTGQVINNNIDQRVGQDGDDGIALHTMGAPVHDVVVANNKVRGGNHGNSMQLAVGGYSIYNIRILRNEFWGAPYGIRTGGYGEASGAEYNILLSGNNIHDLVAGESFQKGDAIDIGDFEVKGPVHNITVTNNRACNAGQIKVQKTAKTVVISGNRGC